jgi:hypothetical protein
VEDPLARATRKLARSNLAATILHHNNKSAALDHMRGSTRLTATVDTIIQIDPVAKEPRSGKLTGLGRVEASNWAAAITLNEAGDGYTKEQTVAESFDLITLRKAGGSTTVTELAELVGLGTSPAGEHKARKRLAAWTMPDTPRK